MIPSLGPEVYRQYPLWGIWMPWARAWRSGPMSSGFRVPANRRCQDALVHFALSPGVAEL